MAHIYLVLYVPADTFPWCQLCGPRIMRGPFFQLEVDMARRQSMSRKSSRKTFRKGVNREHPKNRMDGYWMRGGIRL